MDLIRQCEANRKAQGLDPKQKGDVTCIAKGDRRKAPPGPASAGAGVAPTPYQRLQMKKQEIIEKKPSIKIVKDYFEALIAYKAHRREMKEEEKAAEQD